MLIIATLALVTAYKEDEASMPRLSLRKQVDSKKEVRKEFLHESILGGIVFKKNLECGQVALNSRA